MARSWALRRLLVIEGLTLYGFVDTVLVLRTVSKILLQKPPQKGAGRL